MLAAPPRLLVFDLDGTLIDSSADLCNAVNAALDHVGQPQLPNHLIAGYIGDGAAMLVRRALAAETTPAEGLFDAAFTFFLDFYRAHKLDNTRCYPGVLEALTAIRTRHPQLPMAVLTNKPVHPSREICAALGLAPFFFQNYGGNSFPTKKPDPEGLLTLLREAAALREAAGHTAEPMAAHEAVMIGDSDVDIRTARAIGARAIGCSFGLAPHTLAAAQPDAIVASPAEWPAALGL
jgi:phosphoglycolate phosphatase